MTESRYRLVDYPCQDKADQAVFSSQIQRSEGEVYILIHPVFSAGTRQDPTRLGIYRLDLAKLIAESLYTKFPLLWFEPSTSAAKLPCVLDGLKLTGNVYRVITHPLTPEPIIGWRPIQDSFRQAGVTEVVIGGQYYSEFRGRRAGCVGESINQLEAMGLTVKPSPAIYKRD